MPSSLGLPRSLSLQETFSFRSKKQKKTSNNKSFGLPTIQLDRFLTNEGHQLVTSYFKLSQIQNHIQKGTLHKITEKDVDELLKSYGGLSTPVYETLSYQELNLSHNECKLLAKLLKANHVTNIRKLKLSKNHLSGSSIKVIFEALQKNSTVKVLDLSFNNLADNEAKWLGKLLKKNNTIKEIYLTHNRIKSDGARYLSKALIMNESVERLSLESNLLNEEGGKYISNMLEENDTIKHIHLGSNNLSLEGVKAIAKSLESNRSLVSLSLDINNISEEGAKSLALSLEVNQSLTHLYMPRNNIGDQGLKYICESLPKNSVLTYLDIEFNNIGRNYNVEGMKSLGELLESNNKVPRAINLTYNPIGDEGCEQLFKGFHKNTTLESLILSNCSIGLDGIKAIAESLKLNIGLQNLSLNKNSNMGADGHLMLADALEKNTSLKGVQLDYNFADWESIGNSIQKSLTRNHFLQKEKYKTAANILKASRILLNPTLQQQLPTCMSCSTSPLISPFISPLISPLISPMISPITSPISTPKRLSIQPPEKKSFSKLPFELQENILAYLDTNHVLSKNQILEIISFSLKKSTLNSTMVEFLSKTLSAYYPLTPDVRLWPTESTDSEFFSSERF
ncbi:9861_t:CDS:1 [Funneliformis geosporum]|uniref:14356_t:CDS:1 n=1 Tax=Funneliformis geosporum TaxID=1117311 RepID=A0A9W4SFF9_9GLOM|nr:14356_t:CDS:1 [Funneliformis geosporum]CAI2171494.1 9861_t:CDS:1 [Funneliformis geosporum]